MLNDRGPELTQELLDRFREETLVRVPSQLIEFWKTYGNGGILQSPIVLEVQDTKGRVEQVEIDSVVGLYHPQKYLAMEKWLDVIPRHLPLLPFASDGIGGQFGVSICAETEGSIFHYFGDELFDISAKDLFFVARSPIEVFEQHGT